MSGSTHVEPTLLIHGGPAIILRKHDPHAQARPNPVKWISPRGIEYCITGLYGLPYRLWCAREDHLFVGACG